MNLLSFLKKFIFNFTSASFLFISLKTTYYKEKWEHLLTSLLGGYLLFLLLVVIAYFYRRES